MGCHTALFVLLALGTGAGAVVGDSSQRIVLLDFYADWCGPCRQMAPLVEQLAARGYPVRKVNFDQQRDLATRLGVKYLPTFVMLVDGQVVDRHEGATSMDRLEQMFQRSVAASRTSSAQLAGFGVSSASSSCCSSPGSCAAPPPSRGTAELSPSQSDTSGWRLAGIDRLRGALSKLRPGPALHTAPEAPTRLPQEASEANGLANPARAAMGVPPGPSIATLAAADAAQLVAGLLAATVRIHVSDPGGKSCGSGTIVDARDGMALVVTCGHVFRDNRGQGEILVDMFGPSAAEKLPARLISYDLENDIGLLAVHAPGAVVTAPVAPPGYRVSKGDRVITIGCSNGQEPTALVSRVVSIDRFLGPPNIEVAGLPVDGRSGGGLFSETGLLIGVCNAADPAEKQGLYAALPVVHGALDRANMAYVYRSPASGRTVPGGSLAGNVPPMPKQMPSPGDPVTDPTMPMVSPAQAVPTSPGAAPSAIAAAATPPAPAESFDDVEIVCVVRSRSNPQAACDIVVLNHVSPNFVRQLAAELQQQIPTQWTSFETPSLPLPGPGESVEQTSPEIPPPLAERRVLLEYRAEPSWVGSEGGR